MGVSESEGGGGRSSASCARGAPPPPGGGASGPPPPRLRPCPACLALASAGQGTADARSPGRASAGTRRGWPIPSPTPLPLFFQRTRSLPFRCFAYAAMNSPCGTSRTPPGLKAVAIGGGVCVLSRSAVGRRDACGERERDGGGERVRNRRAGEQGHPWAWCECGRRPRTGSQRVPAHASGEEGREGPGAPASPCTQAGPCRAAGGGGGSARRRRRLGRACTATPRRHRASPH